MEVTHRSDSGCAIDGSVCTPDGTARGVIPRRWGIRSVVKIAGQLALVGNIALPVDPVIGVADIPVPAVIGARPCRVVDGVPWAPAMRAVSLCLGGACAQPATGKQHRSRRQTCDPS